MNGKLLNKVLAPDGLSILVQPIFRIADSGHQLYGVECLSRGPKRTHFERPDVLFEYVRRKKAELAVDRQVIALALRACSAIPAPIQLSVNIHASTLGRDPEFTKTLEHHAHTSGVELSRITIEIVEHAPSWNKPQFLETLADLKRSGVRIALDDVGAGHSNYHMILDASPNSFKVDATIIRDLHTDFRRRAILSSIVKLANELGSSVVAEGIETKSELKAVREIGVELVQGFLFSRPVTVSDLMMSSSMTMGSYADRTEAAGELRI